MAAWNASRESKIETVSSLNLSKFYSDTVVFLVGVRVLVESIVISSVGVTNL